MRTCADSFRCLPHIRDLARCQAFDPVVVVVLSDPFSFAAAHAWCREKWRQDKQQFRIVMGSRRHGPGTFEFADTTHAVEFKLKFG